MKIGNANTEGHPFGCPFFFTQISLHDIMILELIWGGSGYEETDLVTCFDDAVFRM